MENICFGCSSELFLKAMRIAQEYKYDKQKKSNADLNDKPIIEWFSEVWPFWYRERWINHLCGKEKWQEFGEQDYNLICNNEFCLNMDLVLRIIDNLKKHRDNISENLGMIFTFSKNGDEKELNSLIIILRRININDHRRPVFEENNIRLLFRAIEEADKYKYIQSEKRKQDLGEKAVFEWFELYWPKFNQECDQYLNSSEKEMNSY